MVEELKKTLLESFESSSAILGVPRQNHKWPEVFVLMPFTEELRPVYEDHIKNAISKAGLEVGRADDFFRSRSIMSDVWSAINAARVIIADCTKRNPNVFYEIGLAHAVGKETILISQSVDDVPFDLQHLRFIVYEYTPRGMKAFEAALLKVVESIKKSDGGQ